MLLQVSCRNLVKRNKKAFRKEQKARQKQARALKEKEAADDLLEDSRAESTTAKSQHTSEQVRIPLPFILASFADKPQNTLVIRKFDKRLELVNDFPVRCYGDADVLGMLGFGDMPNTQQVIKFFGTDYAELPELLAAASLEEHRMKRPKIKEMRDSGARQAATDKVPQDLGTQKVVIGSE